MRERERERERDEKALGRVYDLFMDVRVLL